MLREKVREWCIEKAIEIARAQKPLNNPSADEVIKVAKQIEKYIWQEK